jgi:hypothetical protein
MRREALNFGLEQDVSMADADCPALSVAPHEFCQLAVSSRVLVRWDDTALGVKGLKDVETGESFVVDLAELMAHTLTDD